MPGDVQNQNDNTAARPDRLHRMSEPMLSCLCGNCYMVY